MAGADSCSMCSAGVRHQIAGVQQGGRMGKPTHLDILDVRARADPAAEGGLREAWVLLEQRLLPDARLRQAGLVQPLHIVQAQPLRLQALLICSRCALRAPPVPVVLKVSCRRSRYACSLSSGAAGAIR